MLSRWVTCALALLPTLAAADPILDVHNGTDLFLNNVKVILDGEASETSGWQLPKAAGTLDLDLSLADFGLSDTQNIHATATVSNGSILWTFNKTFNPPVSLGGGTDLRHAWGTVVVSAKALSPLDAALCAATGCDRNVRLELAPGTLVFLGGEDPLGFDWSRTVNVKRLKVMGGVARPNLAVFYAPSNAAQKPTPQTLPVTATLTSVAPGGGALVKFTASAPQLSFPLPVVVVPQGQSQVTTKLEVPAHFTGVVTLRAYSGGAMAERHLTVAPEADSDDKKDPWDKLLYVPDWLAGCIQCGTLLRHPAADLSLVAVNGRTMLLEPGRLTDVAAALGAQRVTPTAMDASGWTTGTLADASGTFPFVVNLRQRAAQVTRLPAGLSPVAVSAWGQVLANRPGPAGLEAGLWGHGAFTKLALGAGVRTSSASALSNTGYVVGTLADAQGVAGFRHLEGRTEKLGTVAPRAVTTPVAVNAAGEVAAYADVNGVRAALRVDARGAVQRLGVPTGYLAATPTAQNDLGWIVGTATSASGATTGFLWTKSEGMMDLARFADRGFRVTQALAVTNDKQVVLRGVQDGREDLYLVSF